MSDAFHIAMKIPPLRFPKYDTLGLQTGLELALGAVATASLPSGITI